MWKKISASPVALGLLAGLGTVLSFAPIKITSAVVFCPLLLVLGVARSRSIRDAFLCGFGASLVIMLGGFYWVVYVIHVFGNIPWVLAALIYLLFCGLGALGFPAFTVSLYAVHQRLPHLKQNAWWFALGIPALFVLFEFLVPKLFPWYVGHAFFETLWLNQIVEITGSSFLTYLAFSWGTVGAMAMLRDAPHFQIQRSLLVPVGLTLLAIAFSAWRNLSPLPDGKTVRVALVQANIGSLEKVKARQGIHGKVQYTIERYLALTDEAMQDPARPSLILWPETAMPFSLKIDTGYAVLVRRAVSRWNIPLISGGYAPPETPPFNDYNAAFLLEPNPSGGLRTSIYHKNILLAFGEYFPGGETFPMLYRMAPAVSNFRRGQDQQIFTLADGTRLGVTICYEAIVPPFYRKVAGQGVHAVVNLTNDSWFGPTSEPYQHAALSVFRAIETRTPLIRVTNTGTSFTVDRRGKISRMTPVYEEATLNLDVVLPPEPVTTIYLRFGDWFILLLGSIILFFLLRARNVPVPA